MIKYLLNLIQKEEKLAIGLMSGTSMDGIDAALVRIKGNGGATSVQLIHFETFPYMEEEKIRIRNLCSPDTSSVDQICRMNVYLGEKMADAAVKVAKKAGISLTDIDFISSHGQTIYHMPKTHATLQIGELAVIAEVTGCVTIGDFRPSDMAVGGQGAPLVPFTDALLFRSADKGRVFLNIGGISNITVIPKASNHVYGFDTGPGNVLIDEMVRIGTGGRQTFDDGGEIALSGVIHQRLLNKLVSEDPFIKLAPPKSTGRELYTLEFARRIWDEAVEMGLSYKDIVATVTQYTVEAVHHHIRELGQASEIIVSGGGAHNKALLKGLSQIGQYTVMTMEDIGLSSDAKEAISFALLGNEWLHGNYNNLPSVTGATRPTTMGKMVFPGVLKE